MSNLLLLASVGGVSLECLLQQGFEVCWLGKKGMDSSLAAC